MSTVMGLTQNLPQVQPDSEGRPIPKREFYRLRRKLGLSQNAVARAIGRDPGYFGRVLRREVPSAPVWRAVRQFFRAQGVLNRDGHAA